MKKRGLASLSIATTAFEVLARTQARALGEAGLPVLVIPHPLGSRSRAELRDIVAQYLPALAELVVDAPPAADGQAVKP